MHLIFKHGEHVIYGAEIEPMEDSALPQIVLVGAALFRFHELTYNGQNQRWEAQYQITRPLIMPPVMSVHQYVERLN